MQFQSHATVFAQLIHWKEVKGTDYENIANQLPFDANKTKIAREMVHCKFSD